MFVKVPASIGGWGSKSTNKNSLYINAAKINIKPKPNNKTRGTLWPYFHGCSLSFPKVIL